MHKHAEGGVKLVDKFCDNCLTILSRNIRNEDALTLVELYEAEAFDVKTAVNRERLQKLKDTTIAKIANSLIRLEACCLVERTLKGKPHYYHLTYNGKRLVELMQKE